VQRWAGLDVFLEVLADRPALVVVVPVEVEPGSFDIGVAVVISELLDHIGIAVLGQRVLEEDMAAVAMLRRVGFSTAVGVRPPRQIVAVVIPFTL
jgi:hypothetical protein